MVTPPRRFASPSNLWAFRGLLFVGGVLLLAFWLFCAARRRAVGDVRRGLGRADGLHRGVDRRVVRGAVEHRRRRPRRHRAPRVRRRGGELARAPHRLRRADGARAVHGRGGGGADHPDLRAVAARARLAGAVALRRAQRRGARRRRADADGRRLGLLHHGARRRDVLRGRGAADDRGQAAGRARRGRGAAAPAAHHHRHHPGLHLRQGPGRPRHAAQHGERARLRLGRPRVARGHDRSGGLPARRARGQVPRRRHARDDVRRGPRRHRGAHRDRRRAALAAHHQGPAPLRRRAP